MSIVYEKYYVINNDDDESVQVLDLSDFALESFFNGKEFKKDFYDLNIT